jgi:hypothetical protein
MGTILTSAIITSVRRILLDPTPGVTWFDATFFLLVSEAERAICAVKNEAYNVRGAITLAAGTHQILPAGSTGILDIYENTASKRRVTQAPRGLLDSANRYWPNATQEVQVQEWTADTRDPLRFEVFPPNDGNGSVNALYGFTPPQITAGTTPINLADIYEHAIKCFVLGECYAESTTRQDLTKAGYYRSEWKSFVGLRTQSQIATAPKSTAPAGV